MSRTVTLVVVIAAALAGIAAALLSTRGVGTPPALERATRLDAPRALSEFALVDQAGRPYGPDRLRGRWTFLFFGFVNCPDICPLTLAELAEARRLVADLPPEERPEIVFATVDPRRDTPENLARYVSHFDTDFTGLTGGPDAVAAFAGDLGVAAFLGPAREDGSYTVDHSASILLIDDDARLAAVFGTPHEAAIIARDYRSLVAAAREST